VRCAIRITELLPFVYKVLMALLADVAPSPQIYIYTPPGAILGFSFYGYDFFFLKKKKVSL